MSTKGFRFRQMTCGLVWLAAVGGAAASADEFFYAFTDPLSAKGEGVWTVRRGGSWVVIPDWDRSARGVDWGRTTRPPEVTFADPLELYRDRDRLYYLPLPRRSAGARRYSIQDYGVSSTRPSDWKRTFAIPRIPARQSVPVRNAAPPLPK
jgi:hypothetical protein